MSRCHKKGRMDRQRIMENEYGFSQIKIACLGDSLTAASNLNYEEDYAHYPDTVHGNHAGYRILAEHFAGEIVEYYHNRIVNRKH